MITQNRQKSNAKNQPLSTFSPGKLTRLELVNGVSINKVEESYFWVNQTNNQPTNQHFQMAVNGCHVLKCLMKIENNLLHLTEMKVKGLMNKNKNKI